MKTSTPNRERPVLELGTCVAWLLIVLAPSALAQAPWVVTVTPQMNPLPAGFCSAVQLSVLDASGKEPPRNPQGQRVTIADFDMTVVSPNVSSVAGHQIDAHHWSVCGCQGAAVGTTATITASYPARSLSASARVPGVDLKVSARLELAAPKGNDNPPACKALANSAAGTPATPSAPATVSVPPVSPPVTVAPTPAPAPVAVGEALPKGAAATRAAPYVPGPVTVAFDVRANGSWYEPGPVTVTFNMSARGSWYEPGPVTVTFDVSATGNWNERAKNPGRPLQPAPPTP